VSNKNIIQTISDKEMDRKDFLRYVGVILLGVVGLKGLATLIASSEKALTNSDKTKGSGFGSGRYGV
jgi:hypothetical protein